MFNPFSSLNDRPSSTTPSQACNINKYGTFYYIKFSTSGFQNVFFGACPHINEASCYC